MHLTLVIFLIILCAFAGTPVVVAAQDSRSQPKNQSSRTSNTGKPTDPENGTGSISGRVLHEDGKPAVGRVVSVSYGRRGTHPYGSAQTGLIQTGTDGRFHVASLLAGEYIISAVRPCCLGPNGAPPDEANEAPYYETEFTYYLDSLDRKDATPVWVKANEETAGVDIILRRRTLRKVSGTVFNQDGHPLPKAKVQMTRKQKPETAPHSAGVTTFADAHGSWSIDVPDGVYMIQAFKFIASTKSPEVLVPGARLTKPPTPASGNYERAQPRQVSVSGSDVPDVRIDMNRRAQIVSGRVVLEDGGPVPPEASIDVGIISESYNYKPIATDGTFELKGPSLGEQFLSVIIQPFGTYYVKSITWDGTDYMRESFEFGNGVDYRGVQVVLAQAGAWLEGSVPVSGTTAPGTMSYVWLIPEDETKWRTPLSWYSSMVLQGTFTIYAAPGDYLIMIDEHGGRAFSRFDLDPTENYIRKHAPGARHVTLKAGERKAVAL